MLPCGMLQLLLLVVRSLLVSFRSHRDVALENLVLRHQLQVALRAKPTLLIQHQDRLLWVWLHQVWPSWRDHLLIVNPETVIRWHRKGWRLYWTWKSRTRLGRPRLGADVRELIGAMSCDNTLWGTERIRGELLKLGIIVSKRSIFVGATRRRREARLGGRSSPTNSRGSGPPTSSSCKPLGSGPSTSSSSLPTIDVSSCISTSPRVPRQPGCGNSLSRQPEHLIHDRDVVYGRNFGARLANLGIASVRTPFRAPRANSIAERLVLSIRVECLEHVIVINERHLHTILSEFLRYYNVDRPHRSLDLQAPRPREPTGGTRVVSRPVLGGLHHVYARAA